MMPEVVVDAPVLLGSQTAAEGALAETAASPAQGDSCKRSTTSTTKVPTEEPTEENLALSYRDEDAATTASNPNATAVDLEAGPPSQQAEATAEKAVPSTWRAFLLRRRTVCLGVLGLLLTGLSVFLCVLFPLRDPSWHLTKLDIDVMKFASVMTPGANLTDPLLFNADVEFYNPNLIGTTTEPGSFEVFYGSWVMCTGTTEPVTVGGKSSANMHVDVKAQFTQDMADALMIDVVANNMELKVRADVHVVAKAGPLRIKVRAQCDILAATMRLFEDPATVLKESDCTYSYSL